MAATEDAGMPRVYVRVRVVQGSDGSWVVSALDRLGAAVLVSPPFGQRGLAVQLATQLGQPMTVVVLLQPTGG